jgi:hypothetical protein
MLIILAVVFLVFGCAPYVSVFEFPSGYSYQYMGNIGNADSTCLLSNKAQVMKAVMRKIPEMRREYVKQSRTIGSLKVRMHINRKGNVVYSEIVRSGFVNMAFEYKVLQIINSIQIPRFGPKCAFSETVCEVSFRP